MTNHIHLIGIPALALTLAKVFKPVHTQYAQHFNTVVGSRGRVWQSRFYSARLITIIFGDPFVMSKETRYGLEWQYAPRIMHGAAPEHIVV